MKRHNTVLLYVCVIAILAIASYLITPLFLDETVNEPFPSTSSSSASDLSDDGEVDLESLTREDVESMSEEEKQESMQKMQDMADDMPDRVVEDDMPSPDDDADSGMTEPIVVASGEFAGSDAFHKGEGTVTLYELEDGSQVLRFTDFSVTNGPALSVYLADESGQKTAVAKLKGNKGDQNYTVPDDIDVTAYDEVIIYCVPFSVTFATAELALR